MTDDSSRGLVFVSPWGDVRLSPAWFRTGQQERATTRDNSIAYHSDSIIKYTNMTTAPPTAVVPGQSLNKSKADAKKPYPFWLGGQSTQPFCIVAILM